MGVAGFRITNGKGVHITFANGWTVSVQWGRHNYCDHPERTASYIMPLPPDQHVVSAEVACWSDLGTYLKFGPDGDTVCGWVSTDGVARFIDVVSKFPRGASGSVYENRIKEAVYA